MGSHDVTRTARRPLFMQRRSTDEYRPLSYTVEDRRVLRQTQAGLTAASESTGTPARLLATDRVGTAIGLRALNAEWGTEYFEVPEEACIDRASADEVFNGPEVVFDVQTHFLAPGTNPVHNERFDRLYGRIMPDWWKEMDPIVSRDTAEYITNVFLTTENAVAVLTAGPGRTGASREKDLLNDELAAMRGLVEGFAGSTRLLNHTVVHADVPAEIEAMESWRDEFRPVGWKLYTLGHLQTDDASILEPGAVVDGYQLDDEKIGLPFLERARELDVRLVCVHKGLSAFVDNGSPRDIGPAARAFPDLDFVIYHSGYELPLNLPGAPETDGDRVSEEGPYTDEFANRGVNRLIRSVEAAGLGRGSNVYAELGTTWFSLIRRPREAAHVLGKLIATLGEDNVIWGTDAIWYGSAQPLIDALRVFQIPDDMCEQFGYSKLTAATKAKIFGQNAAHLYDVDLERAGQIAKKDDLAWARQLVQELKRNGFDGLHSPVGDSRA
jgi:uncharacterized protein